MKDYLIETLERIGKVIFYCVCLILGTTISVAIGFSVTIVITVLSILVAPIDYCNTIIPDIWDNMLVKPMCKIASKAMGVSEYDLYETSKYE